MNKYEFHEADGCTHFVPVRINKTNSCGVDVTIVGKTSQTMTVVNQVYKFNKHNEPQKPVIPQFVAEWIESQKKSFSDASAIDMYDNLTLDNNGGHYHEVWLWVIAHHHDFIKAWHDGYTVEQGKLYTVEIPDPNSIWKYTFLTNRGPGVSIDRTDGDFWKDDSKNKLTESEIKQDFEWAWQWAKPVEDN